LHADLDRAPHPRSESAGKNKNVGGRICGGHWRRFVITGVPRSKRNKNKKKPRERELALPLRSARPPEPEWVGRYRILT